jgi:glycosyltransferase involved in cell wall biosynthesis
MRPSDPDDSPDLAVLVSFSGQGGVERMVLNLLEELARRGLRIDLLPIRKEIHPDDLPSAINVVPLGASHALTSIVPLIAYLRRKRPAVMLVAKDRAARAALWARAFSRATTRIVVRLGTNLAASLEGRSTLRRWTRYLPMRVSYGMADRVIAVSEGVAEDTAAITGLPRSRIAVVRNPVVTPRLAAMAKETVDHPWLRAGEVPVILGAGRLTRQKDFPTLLRAFARARREQPCRLIVLGEGPDRAEIERLVRELGLDDDVSLPGYTGNPYAYMARAGLFVLSSRWEGSPNVLTEALAVGTPVVSTDCPSGPREILREGRLGPLVPVGDEEAIARAILDTLSHPPDAATLREAVGEFTVERSADAYLEVLGLSARASL